MTDSDDEQWWSDLFGDDADGATTVPDAAWNSALTAAFGAADRPALDDLIPADPVLAAAMAWDGAAEADWPDHADVEAVEEAAASGRFDTDDADSGDDDQQSLDDER